MRIMPNITMCAAIFLITTFSGTIKAIQEYNVKDGDSVNISISSRELTRIAIRGDGRLKKAWSAAGILEIEADKSQGEIYVKPMLHTPNNFSFFVQDDLGNTYTLRAKKSNIPSETVMLNPKIKKKRVIYKSYESRLFVINIKKLTKAMALGEEIDSYDQEDLDTSVPIWKETEIKLKRIYRGDDFLGETYVIRNISDETIIFDEREFIYFGENVKSVSLEKLELAPGAFTFLYVIRLQDQE